MLLVAGLIAGATIFQSLGVGWQKLIEIVLILLFWPFVLIGKLLGLI